MTRSHATTSSPSFQPALLGVFLTEGSVRAELGAGGGGSLSLGDVVGGCKLLRNRYDSRDREWATYTCVLGFHVYGEWGRGNLWEGWGTWSPPWARHAGHVSRGGRQETGRSSPGGPSGPGLSGLGRITWNAAGGSPRLPERRKRCGPGQWVATGRRPH